MKRCECCGAKFNGEEALMKHQWYFETMMDLSFEEKFAIMKKDGYTIKEINKLIFPYDEECDKILKEKTWKKYGFTKKLIKLTKETKRM